MVLKGMPLGSFPDFPYQVQEQALHPGDTFMFMTDGLLELHNAAGEFFGEQRARNLFLETAAKPSEQIVRHFIEAADSWTGVEKLRDDMTILVLKVKNS